MASDKTKLPPLTDEAFDGFKSSKEIKFKKCPHKNVKYVSANTLRCACGACWNGPGIDKLYSFFKTS